MSGDIYPIFNHLPHAHITDKPFKLAEEKKLSVYYKKSAGYRKLLDRVTPMVDCATVIEKQNARAPIYTTSFVWKVSLSLSLSLFPCMSINIVTHVLFPSFWLLLSIPWSI